MAKNFHADTNHNMLRYARAGVTIFTVRINRTTFKAEVDQHLIAGKRGVLRLAHKAVGVVEVETGKKIYGKPAMDILGAPGTSDCPSLIDSPNPSFLDTQKSLSLHSTRGMVRVVRKGWEGIYEQVLPSRSFVFEDRTYSAIITFQEHISSDRARYLGDICLGYIPDGMGAATPGFFTSRRAAQKFAAEINAGKYKLTGVIENVRECEQWDKIIFGSYLCYDYDYEDSVEDDTQEG
jgi:hypothetical protein